MQIPRPPRASDMAWEQGLRTCISNQFPDDVAAAHRSRDHPWRRTSLEVWRGQGAAVLAVLYHLGSSAGLCFCRRGLWGSSLWPYPRPLHIRFFFSHH